MDLSILPKAALAALAVVLGTSSASAQKPQEPLGDLLQVIPLPEPKEGDRSEAAATEAPAPPAATPDVPPGRVVPITLPPSDVVEPVLPAEEAPDTGIANIEAEGEAGTERPPLDPATADGKVSESDIRAAREAAEADAAWEAIQEQRREAINAVESPIVEALNAEGAARAAAETRRIEEEMAAYQRSLVEAEEEARRVEAEHAAIMAEHARRVAREQAEHRARVEACLAGDREACRSPQR